MVAWNTASTVDFWGYASSTVDSWPQIGASSTYRPSSYTAVDGLSAAHARAQRQREHLAVLLRWIRADEKAWRRERGKCLVPRRDYATKRVPRFGFWSGFR
jgi:hypothetical protein